MQLILTSLEAAAATAHSVEKTKIHSHSLVVEYFVKSVYTMNTRWIGAKVDFTKYFEEM